MKGFGIYLDTAFRLHRWRFIMPIVILSLLIPLAAGVMTRPVKVVASISPENLTIGDRFLYLNTIEDSSIASTEPFPLPEKLGDATVLSPVVKLPRSSKGSISYACTLAVYQPGPAKIPGFAFHFADSPDTALFTGDTMTVDIASVLPPDTSGIQMADIRGPQRLRGPIWPYFAIAAALALLTFGGLRLKDKWRRKVDKPQIPPIPPWDLAFERLDALKAERHLEFGRFRQLYFELSLIIRGYIEGRYLIMAVESTTFELESNKALKSLPDDIYKRLFEFFLRADLVKFAKSIPDLADAQADLQFGYDFVLKTKPLPMIGAEALNNLQEVKA